MSPPKDLDLALTRPSVDSKYFVGLQPPAKPAVINQLHAWQVKLVSPTGAPVAHARIQVDGGMPQHGLGSPARPQVTRELPDGGYLIEGMKFSMTGCWEIKLAIDGPACADRVTFNAGMHAGKFATPDQAVRHYVAAPHAAVGHSELTHRHAGEVASRHAERSPIELSDAEVADLVSFVDTLRAPR